MDALVVKSLCHLPNNNLRNTFLANQMAASPFVNTFEKLVKENGLIPSQVYNINELGLNYMLPKKTLASKNETVVGTKLAKKRQTTQLVVMQMEVTTITLRNRKVQEAKGLL